MKRTYNSIKLNTKTFKRKKFFKNLTIKPNELMSIELFRIIQKWQNQISNRNCKRSIFTWENNSKSFVKLNSQCKLYMWLSPIKFSDILAIVLEILHDNINYILEDRETTIELICSQLKVDKIDFYKVIDDIQNILIEFGKVKQCKNGKVVIMYDVQ